MKKLLLPTLTVLAFIIFLSGIRFVPAEGVYYRVSPVLRVEPVRLEPGFRWMPPGVFRITEQPPKEEGARQMKEQVAYVPLDTLSLFELICLAESLYHAGEHELSINLSAFIVQQWPSRFHRGYIILAKGLLAMNRPNEALFVLYRYQPHDRYNDQVYYHMAGAYLQAGNVNQAAECILTAWHLRPGDSDIMARAYTIFAWLDEHFKCRFFAAEIARIGNRQAVLTQLDYYLLHDYQPARVDALLQDLRETDEHSADLHKYQGIYCLLKQDNIKALEHLKAAYADGKQDYTLQLFLAKAYYQFGLLKDSLNIAKSLPDHPVRRQATCLFLAQLYTEMGRFEPAAACIKNIDSYLSYGDFMQAMSLLNKGENYELAADLMQERLQQDPGNYALLNELASTYFKLQQQEKALELYQRSLAIFPFQPDIRKRARDITAIASS